MKVEVRAGKLNAEGGTRIEEGANTEAEATKEPAFTAYLRAASEEEWRRILRHPFVDGIGRGDIDDDRMRYFIAQDYVYLKSFYKALALAAVKAPRRDAAIVFLAHAQNVFVVEQTLHEEAAPLVGLDRQALEATKAGPITVAYTDHLLRAAALGSFAEAVAAVLPCYWTFRDIGLALGARPFPKGKVYRDWIETYRGDAYGRAVSDALALADGLDESRERWPSLHAIFHQSVVYERLFWTQAARLGDVYTDVPDYLGIGG